MELKCSITTEPIPAPVNLEDYFSASLPILGGYYTGNSTLQYAPGVDIFALQLGVSVIGNYSMLLDSDSSLTGISTFVQQLPYLTSDPFRFDLLFLPMMLSFGFAGLAFTVLDVLLLKGDNIVERKCSLL